MHHAVGRQLRDDETQVLQTGPAHPAFPGLAHREVTGGGQEFRVEADRPRARWVAQRLVAARQDTVRVVDRAHALPAAADHDGVRGVGVGDHLVVEGSRVVGTEDRHLASAEGRVDQGFVLDAGGVLHRRTAVPDRLADDPDPHVLMGVGERPQDGG